MNLTVDERAELLTLQAERHWLNLAIARARADGSKVIALEAIEQALAPDDGQEEP